MLHGRMQLLAMIVLLMGLIALADNYPTEPWPATSTVTGLNNTSDAATGLPYPAAGTNPQSTPPLIVQLNRRFQRQNAILAAINQGRVVQIDDDTVGCFPCTYRLAGTNYHYPGQETVDVSTTDDVYYAYLNAASDEGTDGEIEVVTDAVGWPTDRSTYIPLAEITVTDNVIAAIEDVRGRVFFDAGGVDAELAAIAGLATTDSNIIVGNGTTWVAETGATARTSLGLAIGTNVQAWDTDLDAIAGLAKTDSNFIVGNGSAWVAESGATARTSLGLAIGTNVQAWDTDLDAIAGLAKTDSNFIVGNGSAWVAESGATARTSLGLAIGTDVQAYDSDLAAVAGMSAAGMVARTAEGAMSARTITASTAITVSNGDGVAGNPTVSVTGDAIGLTQLADAVEDLLPKLAISAGSQTDHTKTVTIQAQDASANSLSQRFLVRLWIDDADFGAPDATGHTVTAVTTQMREITANADYEAISNASGVVTFDLADSDGGTWYVMAATDGRIYSASVAISP